MDGVDPRQESILRPHPHEEAPMVMDPRIPANSSYMPRFNLMRRSSQPPFMKKLSSWDKISQASPTAQPNDFFFENEIVSTHPSRLQGTAPFIVYTFFLKSIFFPFFLFFLDFVLTPKWCE